MQVNMYEVYDSCADRWQCPTPLINDAVAMRHIRTLTAHMQPDDRSSLSIYRVGAFDDVSGRIELLEKPVLVDTPDPLRNV